jgi:acyl-CoA synthetase (AMP-forming)/AMP-acid ligase II
MDGYLGHPEATARVLRDGWLDTGDLGFLLDGELWLTGRAKDVVILRGRNHAPEEIERAVEGVPGARTGCAVAVSWLPEGAPGEVLALFVEASRQASPAELAVLPAACREAVLGAAGLSVDRVEVLAPGTLPRTSSGKLRRHEALRLYLAGELAPPDPVTPLRLAGAMARSGLAYARFKWERRGDGGSRG